MTTTEAFCVFEEDLPDVLESLIYNLSMDIEELGKPVVEEDIVEHVWENWVRRKVWEYQFKELTDYRLKMIRRITDYLEIKKNPRLAIGRITDVDIAKAKEYPIEDMYAGKLRKFGDQKCGLCPFHSERTPSFYIKNNRFKCYGCDEFGDSLTFYMKQTGCNFIQAVRKLIS